MTMTVGPSFRVRRLLALAPHTDDVELGCGGALARFAEEGADVHVVVFSRCTESLPAGEPPDLLERECREAMPRLGVAAANVTVHDYPVRRLPAHRQAILEALVSVKRQLDPDMVMVPSSHDVHQDHQVVFAEGLRAFKDVTLLGYELPWNLVSFSAHAYVRLEPRHLAAKLHALEAYRSQKALSRPYFERAFLEGLARTRGVLAKATYAEAFEVLRLRI